MDNMVKYNTHLPYEYNESCKEKYDRLINDIFINTIDIGKPDICFSKIFLIHKLFSMNRDLDIFKKDISKFGYNVTSSENDEVIIISFTE